MHVVVLATCTVLEGLRPEVGESWDEIAASKLRETGVPVDVTTVSMSPGRFFRLREQPFVNTHFDYVVMELATAWMTYRTITTTVRHAAPRPIRRSFLWLHSRLTDWAGGAAAVWDNPRPGARGRLLLAAQRLAQLVIRPRPMAAPDDLEKFINDLATLCEEKGARLIVLYAGARSTRPEHGWVRELVDELSARLHRQHARHSFAVVDMLPLLSVYPNPELLNDYLHPNSRGHMRYGCEVAGAINEVEKGNPSFWRTLSPEDIAVDPSRVWSRAQEVATASVTS
jgi:hypothetical protein